MGAGEITASWISGQKLDRHCWVVELVERHVTIRTKGWVLVGLVVEGVVVLQGVEVVALQVCVFLRYMRC